MTLYCSLKEVEQKYADRPDSLVMGKTGQAVHLASRRFSGEPTGGVACGRNGDWRPFERQPKVNGYYRQFPCSGCFPATTVVTITYRNIWR